MDATQLLALIALALASVLIAVFLKDSRMKTSAVLVMLAAGALIFIRLLPSLQILFAAFSALAENAAVDTTYLTLLLKLIGLAYIAEFSAQLARDAGEGAAALKIEFAAKIAILLLALPIIATVITSVLSLLD